MIVELTSHLNTSQPGTGQNGLNGFEIVGLLSGHLVPGTVILLDALVVLICLDHDPLHTAPLQGEIDTIRGSILIVVSPIRDISVIRNINILSLLVLAIEGLSLEV